MECLRPVFFFQSKTVLNLFNLILKRLNIINPPLYFRPATDGIFQIKNEIQTIEKNT